MMMMILSDTMERNSFVDTRAYLSVAFLNANTSVIIGEVSINHIILCVESLVVQSATSFPPLYTSPVSVL